jgi:hypothetical protein
MKVVGDRVVGSFVLPQVGVRVDCQQTDPTRRTSVVPARYAFVMGCESCIWGFVRLERPQN